MSPVPSQPLELAADCSRCSGLCCVLLPYRADAGFGRDKPGGMPCLHLLRDDRCEIHATLRADGWSGCATFDCFGAGQHVTQVTYGGRSWREVDDLGEMGAVLSVMRQLHEMLLHLGEATRRVPDSRASGLYDDVLALTSGDPGDLLAIDVDGLRLTVGEELRAVSAAVRGPRPPVPSDLAGGDLAGRDLRSTDLRGADLRGATLIRADLRGCDLGDADLLGADVRDADARGADLSGALFVNQSQLNAMRGDASTGVPERLRRPSHWPPPSM